MDEKYTKYQPGMGISTKTRGVVDTINNCIEGPFTILTAMKVLNTDYKKTKRLLAYLARKGWLSRIKNGYYLTVPLGVKNPQAWAEDPWITASKIFAPCYIGGFSAAEYWNLTEQIFIDFVVFTSKKINVRKIKIQNTGYVIRVVGKERLFGMRNEWRGEIRVDVSDPSRTIADILNEPSLGGGIRNAALIVKEYFESEYRDDVLLLDYIRRIGNRTVYKRLGFVVEAMAIKADTVIEECKKNMSKGYSALDPSIKVPGRYIRKWNLTVNSRLGREGGIDIA